MSDNVDPKKMVERYVEQMISMAKEAGHMLDKTMNAMEKTSKELITNISQETKGNTEEIKRLASDVMGQVRQDIPKVRAELHELEARAREKLREFERKQG
jgi:phage shock protein A